MLIEINIIMSEKINIIISTSTASVESCQIKILQKIYIKSRERVVIQSIYIKQFVIILSHFEIYISVHHAALPDRNFFFEPDQSQLLLYTHLVNVFMTAVIVKNDFNQIIKILRNLRLKIVQKADFDNCYYIISEKVDVVELTTRRLK